ncbi:MFS transporter [Rhizobium sp. BE258]|uniref:MFS transporter n=1 Tax=Rhizobium sp. BE258 TaxID=2817722 RepID=UPI000DD68EA0|nr:MFS transporter [Rhizobium sp. BE258]MDR7144983.1 putative MFS family arabinose efflux permease [Rhizobium sp. BE258]
MSAIDEVLDDGSRGIALQRVPVALFALAVGIMVTNLFAPQTMLPAIAENFEMSGSYSGFVAMVTLLGYSAGLFLLVPLADLHENRTLVLVMLSVAGTTAALIASVDTVVALFPLLFVLGASCSAIQILVPIAASMAAPEKRGRVIGDVMGGLMVGILLARPAASFLEDVWGWRAFYVASATVTAVLTLLLAIKLPRRVPERDLGYVGLIKSLFHLLATQPVLRSRAISAAIVMAAFNLFWTSVATILQSPSFGLSGDGVGLFALVGAGGAAVTPVFGRMADKGLSKTVTVTSHFLMILGFLVAAWAGAAPSGLQLLSLGLLGLSAVLLDVGVTGDQTIGRHAINHLKPEARGRINGLFVGIFFLGGAAGSAASGFLWSYGGWSLTCLAGAALGALALLLGMRNR